MQETVITLATPIFFLLIFIEWLTGKLRGRNTYRMNDAVNSIGLGIISQVMGIFSKLLLVGLYALTVEHLAERAGMSTRHFTRAFIAETGSTPSKAVERLRLEVARQQVQSSTEAIERVAQSTGFRDPERMRRAFIRVFGQPPQSLRRAARAG